MFVKTESITMQLSGLCDAATRKTAAQTLRRVEGVRSVSVHRRLPDVAVSFEPSKTSVNTITKALESAGFYII